jgi:hypothetical protein
MLDLQKDVFLRLVISAQKDKSLNNSFRNIRFDSWSNYYPDEKDDSAILDKTVVNASASEILDSKQINNAIKASASEKIDEKVEKIISEPIIAEVKMELEVAEALLKKIKKVDMHNPKIPVLELTVARMKAMLEQKSYV